MVRKSRLPPIFLDEKDSVLVVIVVIPVSLGMPAMGVFIPPSMMCVPAALPQFV
jgi:hypothetical protein